MSPNELKLFILACKESCLKHRANESGWDTTRIIIDMINKCNLDISQEEIDETWEECYKIY